MNTASANLYPGLWYELRLEADGDQLRGYINGTLFVQATDTSHASGVSGLVTYRWPELFDDFRVYQP